MARPAFAGVARVGAFDATEDAHAAPGSHQGPDRARLWSLARARQNMVWIYLLGLVFLLFPAAALVQSRPTSPAEWLLGVGVLTLVAAGYGAAAWVCDTRLWVRWVYLVVFTGLVAAMFPFMGWGVIYCSIYVCVLLATLIPWYQARLAILVTGVSVMMIAVAKNDWFAISIALSGLFVGWATGSGIEAGRMSRKLARFDRRLSGLAVSAERERIGRDLHDILGHSLTAISIKAGLAGRLVDRDSAGVRAEVRDIEDIARQALEDVRSTASGYREVRVAPELASARSVLLAAGIEARLPSAVEPLPPEVSELFGYVVREAVTNVVRHSQATTCTIDLSPEAVTVSDDGSGIARGGATDGSGLHGLAERLARGGGRLVVSSTVGVGTQIRAELLTSGADEPVDRPGGIRAES